MRLTGRVACLFAALTATTLGAIAQSAPPSSNPATFYALRKDSIYESGCFAPCACPVLIRGPVRGGFRLTFTGSDGLFDHYSVEHVKWTVPQASGNLHVTGSGTYRVGGEFALQHQLSLDLQIDNGPPQHYDSGLVTPPAAFPAIDARISINGEYCHDTVFEVHARPVRDIQVNGTSVYWDAQPAAAGHDIVWGSLSALRSTGGDFSAAVRGCLANDVTAGAVPLSGADPAPGDGFFFLLRDVESAMPDSFDSGAPEQAEPSDDAIAASPARCP